MEEIADNGWSFPESKMNASANHSTTDILIHILGGAMVLLLSLLYLQSNRQAASKDAIAYAEKMRLQAKATGEEDDTPSRPPADTDHNNGSDADSTTKLPENESSVKDKDEDSVVPSKGDDDEKEEDWFAMNNNWRCACEGGFLPPGMLGGAEAVFRMGTGQCYHKR